MTANHGERPLFNNSCLSKMIVYWLISNSKDSESTRSGSISSLTHKLADNVSTSEGEDGEWQFCPPRSPDWGLVCLHAWKSIDEKRCATAKHCKLCIQHFRFTQLHVAEEVLSVFSEGEDVWQTDIQWRRLTCLLKRGVWFKKGIPHRV